MQTVRKCNELLGINMINTIVITFPSREVWKIASSRKGGASHSRETGCLLPRGRKTRRRAPSGRTPLGTLRSGLGERTCRERWRNRWCWSPPGPSRWCSSPSYCCCCCCCCCRRRLGRNPVAKAALSEPLFTPSKHQEVAQ